MSAPFKLSAVSVVMYRDSQFDPIPMRHAGELRKSEGIGMVLGVVSAVATMGASLPLLGATSLATQVMGGVMMAGGVLTGVGAISGNKKLMKIGGILSLAGGLGGMVSNALGASGTGGIFAPGSGSEAISKMAGGFMDSVNSVTKGIGIGNIYDPGRVSDAMSGAGYLKGDQTAGLIERAGASSDAAINDTSATAGGTDAPPAPKAPGAGNATGNLSLADGPSTTTGASTTSVPGSTPAKTGNWFSDNKELVKMGVDTLGGFAKSAFGPDESAELDAKVDLYKAQANKFNSATDVEQYKLANAKKQVVMISANDPQIDAKIQAAAAAGHEVAFIPATGPVTVNPSQTMFAKAQQMNPQQPVRQPTYATPTV